MTTIFNKSSMKERRRFLRSHMTEAEIKLWSKIRKRQIGETKFRRQYSVGSYVLDFYCPEHKLAIEIDGTSHDRKDAREYDNVREDEIKQLGIHFLRFKNEEVLREIENVVTKINETIKNLKKD
ncbi:MAG: endonuclease domain-containing protein [Bacteroidetes bacterium]|nr:endonuclease domain-containing protein [Bacteroidota bacterium]MBU1422768.1 endonuclease domain-containing protein [Bacteroidota bacterium]MBU2471507.1 endonuclease domain-containing protein [Bacteroidota bacterium]